jgi:hypothetical protein
VVFARVSADYNDYIGRKTGHFYDILHCIIGRKLSLFSAILSDWGLKRLTFDFKRSKALPYLWYSFFVLTQHKPI